MTAIARLKRWLLGDGIEGFDRLHDQRYELTQYRLNVPPILPPIEKSRGTKKRFVARTCSLEPTYGEAKKKLPEAFSTRTADSWS
jgi:hypothetical protein